MSVNSVEAIAQPAASTHHIPDQFKHGVKHLAIIMDGNGRWALQRDMPRPAGHHYGVKAARSIIEACGDYQIPYLTLFAFSSENWARPADEVDLLMRLFLQTLQDELPNLIEKNVKLDFIGDLSAFHLGLQQSMQDCVQQTQANNGLHLNIAVNYGGRWDMTQAAVAIARDINAGLIDADSVQCDDFHRYTCLADVPALDLMIRTGGEYRISNFLIWQSAYAELYFTDCLWPDFNDQALHSALVWYSQRQRRFGKTGEQVIATESSS